VSYGNIAVRVILGAVSCNGLNLDEFSIIFFMKGPENTALNRLQSVGEIWNCAVANDVAGVFEKARVDPAMQRQFDFVRNKWNVRNSNVLGLNMTFAIAVLFNRQFGLSGIF